MPIAFVIIHCDPTHTQYIIRNLKYIPAIKEANDVFGYYEIVCKIDAQTQKELEDVITNKIRRINGIISTMTLTTTDTHR